MAVPVVVTECTIEVISIGRGHNQNCRHIPGKTQPFRGQPTILKVPTSHGR
jgi:hypothetical protein